MGLHPQSRRRCRPRLWMFLISPHTQHIHNGKGEPPPPQYSRTRCHVLYGCSLIPLRYSSFPRCIHGRRSARQHRTRLRNCPKRRCPVHSRQYKPVPVQRSVPCWHRSSSDKTLCFILILVSLLSVVCFVSERKMGASRPRKKRE